MLKKPHEETAPVRKEKKSWLGPLMLGLVVFGIEHLLVARALRAPIFPEYEANQALLFVSSALLAFWAISCFLRTGWRLRGYFQRKT